MLEFAASLVEYCLHHRASVREWGRTPERDRQAGGSGFGPHVRWCAAEVSYDRYVPLEERQDYALLCRLRLRPLLHTDRLIAADDPGS